MKTFTKIDDKIIEVLDTIETTQQYDIQNLKIRLGRKIADRENLLLQADTEIADIQLLISEAGKLGITAVQAVAEDLEKIINVPK